MESDPASPSWIPAFDRSSIWTGELYRFAELGAVGARSTWVGAEAALSDRAVYAAESTRHAREGLTAGEIVERCRIDDVRWALDAFSGAARAGWVALEPRPTSRDDPAALYRSATELAVDVDRPGLAIELPASRAGFEVGAVLLGEGLSVAFDPILTPEALDAALRAHRLGIETCRRVGVDLRGLRAFGFVPLDRLVELGGADAPSIAELVARLDEVLRAFERQSEAETPDLGALPFGLVGAGPYAHGAWIPTQGASPVPPPSSRADFAGETAAALQTAALAARRQAALGAHARLLERFEAQRLQALVDVASRSSFGPAALTEVARRMAEAWGSDETNVAARVELALGLTDALEDIGEQLIEAEVEEVLWISSEADGAAARAFVGAYHQLDGHPELIVTDPEGAPAALEQLSDASVVVLCGLDDDRSVAGTAKRVLERVEAERCIALARPGSSLERLARDQELLAALGPEEAGEGRPELLILTAMFPALLVGLESDDLLGGLDAVLGSCSDDLPPWAHAGARLAAHLAAFARGGGAELAVNLSSSVAGFGDWLRTLGPLSDLGLAVVEGTAAPADDPRRGVLDMCVEGEPGFQPSSAEAALTIEIELPDRRELMQEMLRWTIATEIAVQMAAVDPYPSR